MGSSRNPRERVFTLFGDYLLHRPGAVWVGSLIALLEPLGLSEGAARTALSRMSSRGWIVSERRGRNAFYTLTRKGRELLEEGEARIYRPTWDRPWDGTWCLVHYSIPEQERSLRDSLRLRLSWLGCGSLGNGLWITPHDIVDRVSAIADALEIEEGLEVFRAARATYESPEALVARCWDLASVHRDYLAFIDRQLPRLRHAQAELEAGELSGERAFVQRFDLVHEYRQFPFEDPYLPRRLLPGDWAGDCAAGLFQRLHDLLQEPAEAFVDGVLARAQAETDSTVTVSTH
jgi:phenylacetic acid degradation operon negative regulatory protein